MKLRRSTIILGSIAIALSAVVVLVFLLMLPGPLKGTWLSAVAYQGAVPGSVGLTFEENGRVRVTAAPGNQLWWTTPEYELHLRDNIIEVRSGQEVKGELQVKRKRHSLDLIDRSLPIKSFRLRKVDPS